MDISKKTFLIILICLILLRGMMVILLMNDIPHTGVQYNGWWFYHGGDEDEYFTLAQSLIGGEDRESIKTIGYPLFLIPFIVITGAQDESELLRPLFLLHALFFFCLSILLVVLIGQFVFRSRKLGVLSAAIFTFIPYIFYAFFHNLKPYYAELGLYRGETTFQHINWLELTSDPLSAVLVFFCLFYFIDKLKKQDITLCWVIFLGLLLGFSAMVRIPNVLLMAVFGLALLFQKRIKQVVAFSLASLFALLPQFIYNWRLFGSPFQFGYAEKTLSFGGTLLGAFSLDRLLVVPFKGQQLIPGFWFLALAGLIFFIIGVRYLWQKDKIISFIIVAFFICYSLFYVSYEAGGIQLRFFIPVFPSAIFIGLAALLWIFEKTKPIFLKPKKDELGPLSQRQNNC